MAAIEYINAADYVFGFNYSESTRVANTVARLQTSKRKKSRRVDCDVQLRKNKQRAILQAKLKQQKREALEKLVAEHHRKKTLTK